jgi:uncharacterized protein (DUF885 family)
MYLFRRHLHETPYYAVNRSSVNGRDVRNNSANKKSITTMSNLELYFNDIVELNPSLFSANEDSGEYENRLSSAYKKKYNDILSKYKNVRIETLEDKVLKYVINEGFDYTNVKNLDLLPPLYSYDNKIIDFTLTYAKFYPLETSKDFENLVKRHENFMEFIDSCIKQMKKGVKNKVVLSKFICRRMINNLDKFYNDKGYVIKEVPEEYGYIFKRYERKLKRLIDYIRTKYLRNCVNGVGLCHLPNGKNMYKFFAKKETTTNKTPSEIHKIGLKEVKRLNGELKKLQIKMGFGGLTLLQFYDKLRKDPNNYYTSSADCIKGYESVRARIEEVVMPRYFKTQVTPYKIKAGSDDEGGTNYTYYSPFEETIYINTNDINKIPNENAKFYLVTILLHEGNPGHHYQGQYALEKGIPEYMEGVINGNGYSEGWAQYAESLGGVLYDQTTADGRYNYYGRLNYEMLRTLRLVVDTGIHYYGWSYKKALNYMLKYSSLEKNELENEVERYICTPGEVLSYKIGEMYISDLKVKYMKKAGADPKDFHEKILENGVLPLILLGESTSLKSIDSFIN